MEDKKTTKAKFNQVSAEIEKRIHEGIYVSSQKLPSEYDLAKEFDCSRLTIRKAIDDLIGKNILVKRRGKGRLCNVTVKNSKWALWAARLY